LVFLKNTKDRLGFWSPTTKEKKRLWKVHLWTIFHDPKTKKKAIHSS